jgi:putative PIN family toxin of toxin-antitoxin system
LVSAFLLPGRLNRIADLVIRKAFSWLISREILEEYAAVASRPLYRLTPDELEALLYQVKERAEWVEVTTVVAVIERDPSDDKFLGCAADGRADWIVSGDLDVLRVKEFRGARIGTPAAFLTMMRERASS